LIGVEQKIEIYLYGYIHKWPPKRTQKGYA